MWAMGALWSLSLPTLLRVIHWGLGSGVVGGVRVWEARTEFHRCMIYPLLSDKLLAGPGIPHGLLS